MTPRVGPGTTKAGPLRKTVVIACVVVAAGVYGIWIAQSPEPAVVIAKRLAAERWYAVLVHGTPIGHYRSWGARTAGRHFEFRTSLQFQLRDGAPTRMEDTLVFDRRPPHRLLRASHTAAGPNQTSRSVRIADGVARVQEGEAHWQANTPADLAMGEYLAVETWLQSGLAVQGAKRRARTWNFDRLAVVSELWRLVRIDDDGAVITLATDEQTRIEMGQDLAPRRLQLQGLFVLQRVPGEAAARLWERSTPLFSDGAAGAPVNTAIANPRALRRLVLAVEGPMDGRRWPPTSDTSAGAERLVATEVDARRAASLAETRNATAATAAFPANDEGLRALAAQAVAGAPDANAKADALALFVYGLLRYEDAAGRSVFQAVRDRRGDCTEFANLYTTLARAVALPARTRVGLAYRAPGAEGGNGEFALHAWNEVAVDGVWRGVDPTWGQTRLDATHLPLPEEDILAVAVALPNLVFRVVEATY